MLKDGVVSLIDGQAVLGAAFLSLTIPRTLLSAAGYIDSNW